MITHPESNRLARIYRKQVALPRIEAIYGAMNDEYPEIDSVFDFDNGPPLGYLVDGRDLFDIIAVVLSYYQTEWYGKSSS